MSMYHLVLPITLKIKYTFDDLTSYRIEKHKKEKMTENFDNST